MQNHPFLDGFQVHVYFHVNKTLFHIHVITFRFDQKLIVLKQREMATLLCPVYHKSLSMIIILP